MVDIVQQAGELVGIGGNSTASGGIGGGLIAIILLIAFIVFLAVGIGTWFFIRWYMYKFTIVIWERRNGRSVETARRKARLLPVGKGGDYVLLLNKPKKILPMPSEQTGKNRYDFFVSRDGEWFEITHGDFDEDRKEMGANFLDKEMTYARTSLQRVGEERYAEKNFWEKYGGAIITITTLLIAGIILYLMADKMVELSQSANVGVSRTMEAAQEVLDKADQILGKVDNINTGGSGLKPAT